ncbi:hypothetical protein H4R20_007072, partial [Coemansia guatemalensis]
MFVACSGWGVHSFKEPQQIRHAAIRLIFWARATLNKSIRSELATVSSGTNGGPTYEELLRRYHHYIEDNRPTAVGALMGCNGKLRSAQDECLMQPRVIYVDGSHHMAMDFDNKRVSLSTIADGYRQALDHIDYLFDKLLCGFVVADGIFKPSQLVDQPANDAVGTGFLSHNEVKIGGLGTQLYGHLLTRNAINLDAHTGTDASMDGAKTQQWINRAAELLDHILFAVHIGGGQPARAPELASLLYNNLPSLFRSLHIIKGKSTVCLSTCYWKGQVLQQRNKQVLRFLDA